MFKSRVDNYYPNNPLKFSSGGEVCSLADIIKKAAPEMYEGHSFWVNPLLSSGHTQTAYTALNKFENYHQICYKREIITVKEKTYDVDGDETNYDAWKGKSTFAVDYAVQHNTDSNHMNYKPDSQINDLPPRTQYKNPNVEIFTDDSRPLLIVLHGLSGGSFESYVRALLHEVTSPEMGIDALVINSRGCANHTITTPQLFCGLWTNDLRYFINEEVKSRWPNKKIFLIGFSLGGSIVANYVGQEKDKVYENIKGAFIMGSPWDFSDSSYFLRESLLGDRVYSPVMCQNLIKLLDNHYEGALKDDELVEKYNENPSNFNMNHLRDFDENFTSKLFGFNTSFEYYRHASPIQRIFKIRVPTIIVSSKDDPICGFRSSPVQESPINPYTTVVTTSIGGHLGWFDYKNDRWYPKPIAKLIKEMVKYEVVKEDIKLPLDVDKVWKYDRLYYP